MKHITFWVLIAMACFVIGGVAFWYVWSSTMSSPNPTSTPVTFPSATTTTGTGSQPGTATLSVPAADGGSIQIRDPKNDPDAVRDPFSPDYYYLGYHIQEGPTPDPTASTGAPYNIEYIASTNFFNIVLLQEPIGTARQEAEQYLLTHLGVSQTDLCRLNYVVATPHRVNELYTGRNLLFSFCPGAVKLPQ